MIRCGNRDHTDKATQPAAMVGIKHYHYSVAQVKLCFSKPGQPLNSIQLEEYLAEEEIFAAEHRAGR